MISDFSLSYIQVGYKWQIKDMNNTPKLMYYIFLRIFISVMVLMSEANTFQQCVCANLIENSEKI